jgi:hypothetical protein
LIWRIISRRIYLLGMHLRKVNKAAIYKGDKIMRLLRVSRL